MKFCHIMVAGHSTGSLFYSVGAQEINIALGMHSDRHLFILLLTYLPVHPIYNELWYVFLLCTKLPSINVFPGFAVGM